jgi:DNA helicase MCM8
MLRAACAVAPKAVFVCGSSASAAGLTVSIQRDSSGRGSDVTIEAGALVLADNGMCAIDELDKIEFDHHALLESMEQQSISIAKGGIAATLKCRTAVFAAANPTGGHYDKRKEVRSDCFVFGLCFHVNE